MKALLLTVDFRNPTGERPGGLNLNDPETQRNFVSYPSWQDTEGGREIRLVVDGNVERFRNVEGITVLEGEEAIDAALADFGGVQYTITSPDVMALSLREKGLTLDDVKATGAAESKASLWQRLTGILGIAPKDLETAEDPIAQTLEEKLYTLGVAGVDEVIPDVPTAAEMARWWKAKD